MDPDGDGVDAEELFKFIKEQHAELSGRQAEFVAIFVVLSVFLMPHIGPGSLH